MVLEVVVTFAVTMFVALLVVVSLLLSGMAYEDESDRVAYIMLGLGLILLSLFGYIFPA